MESSLGYVLHSATKTITIDLAEGYESMLRHLLSNPGSAAVIHHFHSGNTSDIPSSASTLQLVRKLSQKLSFPLSHPLLIGSLSNPCELLAATILLCLLHLPSLQSAHFDHGHPAMDFMAQFALTLPQPFPGQKYARIGTNMQSGWRGVDPADPLVPNAAFWMVMPGLHLLEARQLGDYPLLSREAYDPPRELAGRELRRCSDVQHLILRQCEPVACTLRFLVEMPRALETFVLDLYLFNEQQEPLDLDWADIKYAVELHRETLTTLVILVEKEMLKPYEDPDDPDDLEDIDFGPHGLTSLASFTNLRTLVLPLWGLSGATAPWHVLDPRPLTRLLPASLENLAFDLWDYPSGCSELPSEAAAKDAIGKLRELVEKGEHPRLRRILVANGALGEEMGELEKACAERSVELVRSDIRMALSWSEESGHRKVGWDASGQVRIGGGGF